MIHNMSRGGVVATIAALLVFVSTSGNALDKNEAALKKIVEHGKYLVTALDCNICHTPKVFGPQGPVADPSRALSGSPAGANVPEIPVGVLGPDKWGTIVSNDFTTWVGPWGVSFTANLTPDVKSGIGSWTEDMFLKTIRTGKHMGEGRNLLPPMPWDAYKNLTDSDLKSIFAYLKTLKPIENAVHEPIPPMGPGPDKPKE